MRSVGNLCSNIPYFIACHDLTWIIGRHHLIVIRILRCVDLLHQAWFGWLNSSVWRRNVVKIVQRTSEIRKREGIIKEGSKVLFAIIAEEDWVELTGVLVDEPFEGMGFQGRIGWNGA